MNFVQPFRQLVVTIIRAQRVVVSDVVAPPHESIYSAQCITFPPWKDHKCVVEISGGGAGNTPADRVRHIELRSSRCKLRGRVSHGGAHLCFSRGFSRGFASNFPSAARATRASFRAFEIAGRLPSTA